jgi:hypothetical protein
VDVATVRRAVNPGLGFSATLGQNLLLIAESNRSVRLTVVSNPKYKLTTDDPSALLRILQNIAETTLIVELDCQNN